MALNDIVLQGISSNSPPGVYVSLLFAQGISSAPTQVYSALILANGTSAGSQSSAAAGSVFGPDTLTPMQVEGDVINLSGAGSPAHLMWKSFRSINTTTPLYWAPVQAASGVDGYQNITITATGGSTQTTGVVQYSVDGKTPVQVVFAATDGQNTIAANLAAAINGRVNLPVTATSATNVLTVTAKTAGLRTNNLRGFAQVVSGSGVTVSVTSPSFFINGAGSDATNYTSVLNAIATNGQRYYYYIPEAGLDNADGYTNGIPAEIQSQLDSMALPAIGIRQRAIFGSNDTVAHTAAAVQQINDPRLEVIQCKNLDLTAGELAAKWCGAVMLFETTPLSALGVNFDSFGGDPGSQPFWNVRAPLDGSAPSASDIQTAIVEGITPLRVIAGGSTNVVKRITTRWFTTVGGTNYLDLRVTDSGKVTICDRFFDDLQALIALRFPRMLIGNDPAAGSPPSPPGVVTPSKVREACIEVITQYSAAGLINGQLTVNGLQVQRNVQNSSSIGITVPLFVADPLHQVLINGLQLPAIVV